MHPRASARGLLDHLFIVRGLIVVAPDVGEGVEKSLANTADILIHRLKHKGPDRNGAHCDDSRGRE